MKYQLIDSKHVLEQWLGTKTHKKAVVAFQSQKYMWNEYI